MKKLFCLSVLSLLLSVATMVTGCGILPEELLGGDDDDKEEVDGGASPSLALNQLSLPGEGAEYVVALKNVTASTKIVANIMGGSNSLEELRSWCHVEVIKEGILIKIDTNAYGKSRTVSVNVKTVSSNSGDARSIGIIEVSQPAYVPRIAMSSETLLLAKQGGVQEISVVSAGQDYKCIVDQGADWCVVSLVSGKNFRVTAAPNPGADMREAMVMVSGSVMGKEGYSSFTIRQMGDKPVLEVSTSILGFSILGGTNTFSVASSLADWTVEQPEKEREWCSWEKDGSQVTVTVKPYLDVIPRQGVLTIKAGELSREVTIVQYSVGEVLIVPPSFSKEMRFPASGGMKKLDVVSNQDYITSVEDNWCLVANGVVLVTPNQSVEPRKTVITLALINGQSPVQVLVWQEARDEPIIGTWEFAYCDPVKPGIGWDTPFIFRKDGTMSHITEGGVEVKDTYTYNKETGAVFIKNIPYATTLMDDNTLQIWDTENRCKVVYGRVE